MFFKITLLIKSWYIYINDNINVQLTKHCNITATKEDLHFCTDSWSSYLKIPSKIIEPFVVFLRQTSDNPETSLWLSDNK